MTLQTVFCLLNATKLTGFSNWKWILKKNLRKMSKVVRTTIKGQPKKDSKKETARKGQPEKDSKKR